MGLSVVDTVSACRCVGVRVSLSVCLYDYVCLYVCAWLYRGFYCIMDIPIGKIIVLTFVIIIDLTIGTAVSRTLAASLTTGLVVKPQAGRCHLALILGPLSLSPGLSEPVTGALHV